MKSDSIYIEHILNSINSIQEYISGLGPETFLEDRKTQDAVVRQFDIIGEASKRISQDFRDKNPDIPWSHMAGMRDVLIHDYIDLHYKQIESFLLNATYWNYDLYNTTDGKDNWNLENFSLLGPDRRPRNIEVVARPYPLCSSAKPKMLFFDLKSSGK